MKHSKEYGFLPVSRGIGIGNTKVLEADNEPKSSDYNKTDLKGNAPVFKIPFKVGQPPIPERLAVIDSYPGIHASRICWARRSNFS